jgi:CRISPR system Cascade subunit CasB
MTDHKESDDTDRRRWAFVTHLYGLHRALNTTSGGPEDVNRANRHHATRARAELAVLRRSFAGPRQEAEAYGIVFEFDPPESEQRIWLLVGGVFALHPQATPGEGRRKVSLGGALGTLARDRGDSVTRRFTELVSVEDEALEHYLRQAVQLLRAGGVTFDYYRLMDDLATLLAPDPHGLRAKRRQRVRLAWTRDYHAAARSSRPTEEDDNQ